MENHIHGTILLGTTIHEAINEMNAKSLRTAFIIDENGKLAGSLSDGDLRRALLKGLSTGDFVEQAMNDTPIVCDLTHSKDYINLCIKDYGVLAMPIVDGEKLVDVVWLQNLSDTRVKDNTVFIMAGGFGTRLRPHTNDCPKPMLDVSGNPMLYWTIKHLKRHGFRRFIISTYYLPEVIENYFGDGSKYSVEIDYVCESQPLGTGGALSLLRDKNITTPLLMLNGDILTDLDFSEFLRFHEREDFVASMCLVKRQQEVSYGVVQSDGVYVTSILEKPIWDYEINSGIYVLSQEFLEQVPIGQAVSMPDMLSNQISLNRKVGSFSFDGYWLDIGSKLDYTKAQNEIHRIYI